MLRQKAWSRLRVLETVAKDGRIGTLMEAFRQAGLSKSTGRTALNKNYVRGYVRQVERGVWEVTPAGYTAMEYVKETNTERQRTSTCIQCGEEYGYREQFGKDGKSRGYWTTKKFCSFDCYSAHKAANAVGFVRGDGYLIRRGVRGHRVVMEQMLGRKLRRGETVHHKNGNRADNRPENLELWAHNHPPGQRKHEQDIWSGNMPSYQFNAL